MDCHCEISFCALPSWLSVGEFTEKDLCWDCAHGWEVPESARGPVEYFNYYLYILKLALAICRNTNSQIVLVMLLWPIMV